MPHMCIQILCYMLPLNFMTLIKIDTCTVLTIAEEGVQNTETTTGEFASSMSKTHAYCNIILYNVIVILTLDVKKQSSAGSMLSDRSPQVHIHCIMNV